MEILLNLEGLPITMINSLRSKSPELPEGCISVTDAYGNHIGHLVKLEHSNVGVMTIEDPTVCREIASGSVDALSIERKSDDKSI